MRILPIVVAPLCYNCIYNQPQKNDPSLEKSMCSKFNRYSDICRLDETRCGKEGKSYKEKQNNIIYYKSNG